MCYRLTGVMLISLMLAVVAAHPTRADASKGGQLAQQWCANCHVVGGNPTAPFHKVPRSGFCGGASGVCRLRIATGKPL